MTGMGMHPPIPLDQARAASKAVADAVLTAEITKLHGQVRALTRSNDRLMERYEQDQNLIARLRAERDTARGLRVVEPDDDELNASIARHPAGKGRRP